jgi:hypothetical protein
METDNSLKCTDVTTWLTMETERVSEKLIFSYKSAWRYSLEEQLRHVANKPGKLAGVVTKYNAIINT